MKGVRTFLGYRPRPIKSKPKQTQILQIMQDEKPKLVLNKRTIAHLNNLEMIHVRGGEGDDVNPTRKACNDKDTVDNAVIIKEVTKTLVSILVKVC